jgi:hypothetical protein
MDEESRLPLHEEPRASLARLAAQCSVMLPRQLGSGPRAGREIECLEKNCFVGWQRSRWLAGLLVLVLDEELRATVDGVTVKYDREYGLEVETTGKGAAANDN